MRGATAGKTGARRAEAASGSQEREPRGDAEVPAELWFRFMKFRHTSAAGTRIPEELRQAVVNAIDGGVPMDELGRALGITASQVAEWRRRGVGGGTESRNKAAGAEVRIFKVADERMEPEGASVNGDGLRLGDDGEPLELRLGGWSVIIRRG